MYARLAAAADLGPLRRLRLCVSGSAPLAADLHARIAARTGQAVLERYGMTETAMLVSNPVDGERRPGTVGLPLPGVEVRLDPAGGEILVRGPNVFAGYWQRPEATAAAFTADGWFRTGDVGAWDEAGYLAIVGRAKELIITGGYNVYPREIEDVLRAHPAVVDVAVVGTPSAEWGEVVTAYVEPGRASTPRRCWPGRRTGWRPTSGPRWSTPWVPCPATPWGRWSAIVSSRPEGKTVGMEAHSDRRPAGGGSTAEGPGRTGPRGGGSGSCCGPGADG